MVGGRGLSTVLDSNEGVIFISTTGFSLIISVVVMLESVLCSRTIVRDASNVGYHGNHITI
jgi:hypothetical protein